MSSEGIDPNRVPNHVACVMDGNGRWAQRPRAAEDGGHAAGEEAMFDTVDGALEVGVRWLSMFAFSTENWRRPPDEVRYLMNFNEGILTRHRDDLDKKVSASVSPAGGTGGCRSGCCATWTSPLSGRRTTGG